MKKITFVLSLAFLVAATFPLSGCLTGTGSGGSGGSGDSISFTIPSASYSLYTETPRYQQISCYPNGPGSAVCDTFMVNGAKVYLFDFESDSLDIPRRIDGKSYSYETYTDRDSLNVLRPCRIALEGFLKSTSGSGSSATRVSVLASTDSGQILGGEWRSPRVLFDYLFRTDTSIYYDYWRREDRAVIPERFILGGRGKTRRTTLAAAESQVNLQCEKYFTGDSIQIYDYSGPCGGGLCYRSVAVCSDSGKTAYLEETAAQMSNDKGRVYMNTSLLLGPNMSYEGSIRVTCPE